MIRPVTRPSIIPGLDRTNVVAVDTLMLDDVRARFAQVARPISLSSFRRCLLDAQSAALTRAGNPLECSQPWWLARAGAAKASIAQARALGASSETLAYLVSVEQFFAVKNAPIT